jgi:hypothetical protein
MKPMTFDAWLAQADGSSVEKVTGVAGPSGSVTPEPVPPEEVSKCACILMAMIAQSKRDQSAGRFSPGSLALPILG